MSPDLQCLHQEAGRAREEQLSRQVAEHVTGAGRLQVCAASSAGLLRDESVMSLLCFCSAVHSAWPLATHSACAALRTEPAARQPVHSPFVLLLRRTMQLSLKARHVELYCTNPRQLSAATSWL